MIYCWWPRVTSEGYFATRNPFENTAYIRYEVNYIDQISRTSYWSYYHTGREEPIKMNHTHERSQWQTNRKSYMVYQTAPLPMTLSYLHDVIYASAKFQNWIFNFSYNCAAADDHRKMIISCSLVTEPRINLTESRPTQNFVQYYLLPASTYLPSFKRQLKTFLFTKSFPSL